MSYKETADRMNAQRMEIFELRQKIRELQSTIEPQEVEDYGLETADGKVQLSDLFGDKDTLFVIHNMGTGCSYCTLWADGLNGVAGHLQDRAAFVMSTPDDPNTQAKFKASRGWTFPMVSDQGSGFTEAMGYKHEEHGWMPGVSVFQMQDGKLLRVSDTAFGPGDDFCAVWHLFDMIPQGPDGWQPQYKY